ncbi:MAG: hypothetical protein IKU43_08440 [Clostridia bacterium]|nr:hypothetical protein [Clostridia bacterium]
MNFKKLSALLLSGVLLANSVIVTSFAAAKKDEEEEIVYNLVDYTKIEYNSPEEKLATMKLYDEKGDYQLWALEETGEIALVTKGKDGAPDQILLSNPYDVASMKKADEPKNRLLSQILLKYSDGAKETQMNSYVEAAKNRQIKLERIRGGIRVNYTMGREQARILVPEMIEKSRFEEEILNKMPSKDENGKKIYDENIKKNPYEYMKAFFTLKDPNSEKLSKDSKEDMMKTFPITEKYAIYILGTDSTVRDKKQLEYLITTYTDYTFDDIDADHAKVEYEARLDKLPLFKVAIEYFLDENGLTVRVPASDIRFDSSSFSLSSITVLPYFGAGANDETGFTLVNDGSGSIVRFEDVKDSVAELTITGKVYGQDYSFHKIGGENQEVMRLPAFGTVSNSEYWTFDKEGYDAAVASGEIIPYADYQANIDYLKAQKDNSKKDDKKEEETIAQATAVTLKSDELEGKDPEENPEIIEDLKFSLTGGDENAELAVVEVIRTTVVEEEAVEGEEGEAAEATEATEAPEAEAETEEADAEAEEAPADEKAPDVATFKVTAADGKPLAGAVIKLNDEEKVTDAQGKVEFELLETSNVYAKLSAKHTYLALHILEVVKEGEENKTVVEIDPVTGLPVMHPKDSVNIAQSGKFVNFDDEKTKLSSGFIAYIEEGESLAEITTAHGGGVHDYNSTYATFTPRPTDSYELEGLSATGSATWSVKSNRKYTGNFTIKYIPVRDEKATTAGLAEALRNYLVDKGSLTKLEDTGADIPLYIETFGSVNTTQRVAGIPFQVQTPLTTFADAKTMIEELTAKDGDGVKTTNNIIIKYTGWYNGGLYKTVPAKVKVDKAISEEMTLAELSEYAASVGASIYPDLEFTYVNDVGTFDGFNYKDDAVQTIDGRTAVHQVYSALYQMFEPDGQLILSPLAMEKYYGKISEKYKALGANGLSVGTLGSDLSSDHNDEYAFTREDSKETISGLLAEMKEDNKSIMVNGGNAYALAYADHILNIPLNSSENVFASEAVPFVGMVLHGYKNFAGTAINLDGDYEKSVLKAIENGASPYFILSYQHNNTSELKSFIDFSKYYSIRYNIWVNDLVDTYNTLNDALSSVKYETITNHETLETRIVRVTYSNGEQFVLNYNIGDYEYTDEAGNTTTIPAMGFVKFAK